MKELFFRDYEKRKGRNKGHNFSYYDYIYHVINDANLSSDIIFAFSELFLPKFIVVKDYVFLEQNFTEHKLIELEKSTQNVEYWMNLLLIDPFFENDPDSDQKAEFFSKQLLQIWSTKLKNDFPERNIKVEYLFDSDVGDYAITFYDL